MKSKKKVFTKNGTLFSPNSGEDQKKVFTKNGTRRVARNSQWGGQIFGLGAEPPAAEGQSGLGAKTPAAEGWGSEGEAPSRHKHGGLGAEPQHSKILHFFAKIA